MKLTALTLKGLIYNICDLFDERLQQQTIAAAAAAAAKAAAAAAAEAAGAISQR